MDDKLKVFWNLDVLVKMCRSKSDGPSLRIEEIETEEKINSYTQEIEEIKTLSEEDIYDTSAEMADRNIEIITKKQLQKLKSTLKEKNKELNILKEEESRLYEQSSLLRDSKSSQEKYITSMQERINESTDSEIIDRYNSLIAETSEKVSRLKDEIVDQNDTYNKIQKSIMDLTEEIANIEDQIDKKKKLLFETQANLENKENYIDKTKREKNNKRIVDLESKIQKLASRLDVLRNDPKYIETKIKDVINNKDNIEDARSYLINLINQVIEIPYINVATDNALEEELLRATQARDSFANEIDQKSYNILEANTPEKVRVEFLTKRISKWQEELEELNNKINLVDKDRQFDYEKKNILLNNMIRVMKNDLKEFERAYDEAPDINIGAKAGLKAALDEKKEDIVEAEKIATAFKIDEAEDISEATRTLKYECEKLNNNIYNAEVEISNIKNRLMSKKSGLIDITSRNKDKDTLKELAQIVIDIKHRRSFPETPIEIVNRLEEELQISLVEDVNTEKIKETSNLEPKDYEEYLKTDEYELLEVAPISDPEEPIIEEKRGIRVVDESEIVLPEDDEEESQASKDLQAAIKEATSFEEDETDEVEEPISVEADDYQPEEDTEVELPSEEDTVEESTELVSEEPATEYVEEPSTYEQEDLNNIQESNETEESSFVAEESPIEENPVDQQELINPFAEELIANEPQELTTESNESELITNNFDENIENQNIEEPIESQNEEVVTEDIRDEALDIESIINQVSNNQPEEEYQEQIELEPTLPESDYNSDLSINSIFNTEKNNTERSNSDNIVSSENLANELDEYLNNLDNN